MENRLSTRMAASASLLGAVLLFFALLIAVPAWAADDTVAVKVGDATTVTSTLDCDSATQHIDYTVADSSVATVNKHKGLVTGAKVGTTTVTAHVVNRAYVSGGGTGGADLCADEVEGKTQSWTVSVLDAAGNYGLQGVGLHIKMLSPMVTSVSGSDVSGGYTNEIGIPMNPCSHGFVTFTYSQDGALNNGLDTYITNSAADIYVIAGGSTEKAATLAKTGALTASIDATAGTVTLAFDTSALGSAKTGTLCLGSGIKNNNGSKTVGLNLNFPFTVGEQTVVSVTDPAVDATCTVAGKTEGSHCGVCGKVIMAQADTPAFGHTPVTDPAVPATCTSAGKTEGSHCGVCKDPIVAQAEVPMAAHAAVTDAAVTATTTAYGKTAGSHCKSCGKVLVAQSRVKMLQKISAKTVKLTVKKGKKSAKKIAVSAKGKLAYKKVSGKSGISIVSVTGGFKVKASKSVKPGTYKIKVRATAGATSSCQAAPAKTIAVTVKVTK